MSHIPNSAMPHAGAQTDGDTLESGASRGRLGQLADKVREHPKAAVAAGAAVAVGVAAAAAIPAIRSRGRGTPRARQGPLVWASRRPDALLLHPPLRPEEVKSRRAVRCYRFATRPRRAKESLGARDTVNLAAVARVRPPGRPKRNVGNASPTARQLPSSRLAPRRPFAFASSISRA